MFDIHSFVPQIFTECLLYVSNILVSGESEVSVISLHPMDLIF